MDFNSDELSQNLFLILSNVPAVISIVYALHKKLFPEAALISTVGVVSFLYHACQGGFFCIFKTNDQSGKFFGDLQNGDEFFVQTAFAWFALYVLEVELTLRVSLIFLLQPVFIFSILSGNPYFVAISFTTIGSILIIVGIYLVIIDKTLKFAIGPTILTLVLLIPGLVLFYLAGEPGSSNYWYMHSSWHIFLMIDLLFILMIKSNTPSIYINTQEIYIKKNSGKFV